MTEPRGLTSVEQIGLTERLLRVFHAPRRTFESVADGGSFPDWAAPVAVVVMFWAAHNLAVMPIVAPETPSAIAGWEQLTEDQRQVAVQGLEAWRSHGWLTMPLVSSFSSLAIVGLVLLGVCRLMLRAEISLRQTLAVKAYASLVAVPQWILLIPLVRAGDAAASPLTFPLGALLGDPSASLFGRFLGAVNVFDLWQVAVVGIGLSVMTGQPARRTTGVVFVLFIAWFALGALAPTAVSQTPTP